MHHTKTLVQQFHSQHPQSPQPSNLWLLMAQQPLKEGILSQSDNSNESKSSRIEWVAWLGKYPDWYRPMEMTCQQVGRPSPYGSQSRHWPKNMWHYVTLCINQRKVHWSINESLLIDQQRFHSKHLTVEDWRHWTIIIDLLVDSIPQQQWLADDLP